MITNFVDFVLICRERDLKSLNDDFDFNDSSTVESYRGGGSGVSSSSLGNNNDDGGDDGGSRREIGFRMRSYSGDWI